MTIRRVPVRSWAMALVAATWPLASSAQRRPSRVAVPCTTSRPVPRPAGARDTVVRADPGFGAGGLRRFLLGDDYRDAWAAPIRVPLLDLEHFAGGLHPLKIGGGAQTRNLHLAARNGVEYVFRPVRKERLGLPDEFDGTVVRTVFRDQLSASHPAATVMAPPVVAAAGVLHPTPRLVVMPDDSLLGKFRAEFAGEVGTIEEDPTMPEDAPGFAGAVAVIDSDDLLKELNSDPRTRVDLHALLAARLVDMMINDNDRHPGQWKWAKLRPGPDVPWEPIARDRDKAFESYDGLLLRLARVAAPKLVAFTRTYPNLAALSYNAIDFDRRLLVGLDRAAWDSVARHLRRVITDSVIDAALDAMPPDERATTPPLRAALRARRDRLPDAANHYFQVVNAIADIHATDADDRATVVRRAGGAVEIQIRSGSRAPYFTRRFDAAETKEIRLYLHGGDDSAVVVGHADRSITVRIIGGNGTNTLIDSSTVAGRPHPTKRYDAGTVSRWHYRADTVHSVGYDPDTAWNRRPWFHAFGSPVPPVRDRGASLQPIVGIRTGRGLGLVPTFGFTRYAYGFRQVPYATKLRATASYSTGVGGWDVSAEGDRRFEGSRLHLLGEANMSQLEMVEFHGLGNAVPDRTGSFYDVRQQQWVIHPALGLSLGPGTDVSVGPIAKYVTTSGPAGGFLSHQELNGVGHVGQAGLQVELHHDTRDDPQNPHRGLVVDASGIAYPGIWNLKTGFQQITASAATYFPLSLPPHAVLAVHGGGEKLFGAYPFYEAAYIGGSRTVRTIHHHQFLGDASVFGGAELRVPLARFAFVLPLDLGAIGWFDAGRVYLHGASPGGWHSAAGAGFWLGVLSPATGITVSLTNRRERRVLFGFGVSY